MKLSWLTLYYPSTSLGKGLSGAEDKGKVLTLSAAVTVEL